TYVENFETIRAEQPILRVLDTARIELTINIPETLIASLPYVENIRVRYDAFPDVEIPAEISEVGSEASQSTRTYPVTLIMDQPAGAEILPGMAGRAMGAVQSDRSDSTLVIPVTAVFSPEAGAKSFVWVIDAATSTVSRREIDAQRLVTGGVEVTSGLTRGDLIAVAGVHFLAEGQRVKPVFD
ncbi:MAG: efflux RND transporter periplasmic adaptor subunit, partial [Gammaproteobacteria bacterium]|nr:efflux RND transporter periplasmic adaptor subunit [Gammaproteobacteria bacterium]